MARTGLRIRLEYGPCVVAPAMAGNGFVVGAEARGLSFPRESKRGTGGVASIERSAMSVRLSLDLLVSSKMSAT